MRSRPIPSHDLSSWSRFKYLYHAFILAGNRVTSSSHSDRRWQFPAQTRSWRSSRGALPQMHPGKLWTPFRILFSVNNPTTLRCGTILRKISRGAVSSSANGKYTSDRCGPPVSCALHVESHSPSTQRRSAVKRSYSRSAEPSFPRLVDATAVLIAEKPQATAARECVITAS